MTSIHAEQTRRITKAIQRKRSLDGLHKYQEEIDRQWISGEITMAQFHILHDEFVKQATLINRRFSGE
jgi:phage-related minor tail protein